MSHIQINDDVINVISLYNNTLANEKLNNKLCYILIGIQMIP